MKKKNEFSYFEQFIKAATLAKDATKELCLQQEKIKQQMKKNEKEYNNIQKEKDRKINDFLPFSSYF